MPKHIPSPEDRHQLSGSMIENPRFGTGADDIRLGWYWSCICGMNNTRLNWRLPYIEAEAFKQFDQHLKSPSYN